MEGAARGKVGVGAGKSAGVRGLSMIVGLRAGCAARGERGDVGLAGLGESSVPC